MIKPFGDNILVQPIEKKTMIISSVPPLTTWGKVLEIGKDVKKVKVGDIIWFVRWGLNETEHPHNETIKCFTVPESPEIILATLENEEA